MEINIKTSVLEKNKITLAQFSYLLALQNGFNTTTLQELHTKKLLLDRGLDGTYYLNRVGNDFINKVLVACIDTPKQSKKDIEEIARAMQKMYPTGRKAGTNNYWRGNFPEIRDRLTVFFKKHGEYSKDVILEATQKYIDSFQGETGYMKTLKYFISKRKDDGAFEYDLLTFIENIDSADEDGGVLDTTRLI